MAEKVAKLRTVMRTLLTFTLLSYLVSSLPADDAKPKLGVGDTAPPLRVTRWLQGGPVTFAPRKVYVVDFWATWCGPCIASMPHLSEIAAKYKDQGLAAVAVTTVDPDNTVEAVEAFVKGKGAKFGFGFAICEDQILWSSYMEAAEQVAIPCSFVVDRDGKIAFIGHPADLDEVIPKVLDGTWRGQVDAQEIARAGTFIGTILNTAHQDPGKALAAMDEFADKYPGRASSELYLVTRVMILMMTKDFEEAEAISRALLARSRDENSPNALAMLGLAWTGQDLNPDRKHVEDIGLAAIDAALASGGDKDVSTLMIAAEACFAAGKRERAIELGKRAVNAAPAEIKETISKRFEAFKKDKEKDRP